MSASTGIEVPEGSPAVQAPPARARWRRLFGQRRFVLGLIVIGSVLGIALIGPMVSPHKPDAFIGSPFSAPGADAALGTDSLGRDVLSRTLAGGWTVVWMSTLATALGMITGVAIGLAAGYLGSMVDNVSMRLMEVLQAFPSIVLILLFVSLVGVKLWLIVVLVALAWTPQVARVTRGITLEIIGLDFVRAQEILGTPSSTIIVREILPNLTSPLLVEAALRLTWSVGLISALSFLGFGIQPPTADWGLMINENRQAISVQPWAVIAPIVCIGLLTVGTNMIAEGLSRVLGGVDRRA